jgi:hypothetical protein
VERSWWGSLGRARLPSEFVSTIRRSALRMRTIARVARGPKTLAQRADDFDVNRCRLTAGPTGGEDHPDACRSRRCRHSLTPVHARHLAGALRLQLALRWETAELGPMPCREEVERARGLLDLYAEQLERLDWGEPAGELSL